MFFGNVGGSSSVSAIPLFNRLTKLPAGTAMADFKKRPDIQKKVEAFREAVATIDTTDKFFKNRRVMEFALAAYGMESEIQYPARIKQVMMSDPNDRYSVANRMLDDRYRTLMTDFDFAQQGSAKLQDSALVDKLVEGYLTNQYEKTTGELSPNLTNALYFRRKVSSLVRTTQLYNDPVMFSVVKEALSIADSAVAGSGERLTTLIERGFDVSKVGDQKYVDRFIQRYLAVQETKAAQSSSNPLLGMFA